MRVFFSCTLDKLEEKRISTICKKAPLYIRSLSQEQLEGFNNSPCNDFGVKK